MAKAKKKAPRSIALALQKNPTPELPLKNPKQELFSYLYAGHHNRYLFANATRCYMQAYGYNERVDKLTEQIDERREKLKKRKKRPPGAGIEEQFLDDEDAEHSENTKERATIYALEKQITAIEKTAQVEGSKFLSNPIINARVDWLMEQYVSDNLADRELLKTILQDDDLGPKVQAIKEYNRLKQRGAGGMPEGNFTFSWTERPKRDPITVPSREVPAKELKAADTTPTTVSFGKRPVAAKPA